MSFVILGHRGMGPTSTFSTIDPETLPENSIAAFEESLDLGADGIEFDVHMTHDHQVAVIHDDVLNKKIAGANRKGTELGLTSSYNMAALGLMDIGNGHRIPTLENVLDMIVARNPAYREVTGKNLTIDIEFKGEGTVLPTYEIISRYIEAGLLEKDDFIFNSFHWDRLEELKSIDSHFKVMPAIKTKDLFGEKNVIMPGFRVAKGATYIPEAFQKLADFNARVPCYAFDCVIFDLRTEMIDFCEEQGVGLFTSTSYESVRANELQEPLSLMIEARERLAFTGFRADHVTETQEMLADIESGRPLRVEYRQNDQSETGTVATETTQFIPFITQCNNG